MKISTTIETAHDLRKFLHANKKKITKLMTERYKDKVGLDALLLSMLDITIRKEISISLDSIDNVLLVLNDFIKTKEKQNEQKSLQKNPKKPTGSQTQEMRVRPSQNKTVGERNSKNNHKRFDTR
jgi:hypothetical protein